MRFCGRPQGKWRNATTKDLKSRLREAKAGFFVIILKSQDMKKTEICKSFEREKKKRDIALHIAFAFHECF